MDFQKRKHGRCNGSSLSRSRSSASSIQVRHATASSSLEDIASSLDGGAAFVAALRSLDEDDYLELTRNFRNLASHAIAPRLTVGHTNMVVRRVVAAT